MRKEATTGAPRFTSADLDAFPDNGKRYEIIDGELYVSKQPHAYHQLVCTLILVKLQQWSDQSEDGVALIAPGLIFADDDDVAPDVLWVSSERMAATLGEDGKFHAAPELIVEVLSPGAANEKRDRDAKLKLYSRRGVQEYWIVDWRRRSVEIFRRKNARLFLAATLAERDALATPLLSGFSCPVSELFARIPRKIPGLSGLTEK
jgi:Uma2 family endonuclease